MNQADDKPKDKDKTFTIIVNGRKREVTDHKLTEENISELAGFSFVFLCVDIGMNSPFK